MSDTNGRIDYGRLVSDIDFASAFEGTRFEQYTDREEGLGSILGGWLGAIIGRFVGLALGQVAQELLVDELFGAGEDDETEPDQAAGENTESEAEDGDTNAEGEPADAEGSTDESDEETAEADVE
ncbi:MAG: hypothetical protein U9O06_08065 [Euryarchaeota archaeon]|nr:hypothetical protein [Euryarchaeota archaeon]